MRVATVLLLFCATSALAQSQAELDTKPIEAALSKFLSAFDNLDWPLFRACFSSNATVFYPVPRIPKRIDAPGDFERAWQAVFAAIKTNSGRSAPPYMELRPRDLKIEMLSPDVAISTFHLVDGKNVSRRTFVWKKFEDGWKIVHLHASNLTEP